MVYFLPRVREVGSVVGAAWRPPFLSVWIVFIDQTAPINFGIGVVGEGTFLFTIFADFSAIRGRISWTISNFSFVFSRWAFFVRCVLRRRPHSFSARSSPVMVSSTVATASLASDVNGTLVEQTWTRTIAGPNGRPEPPRCSRPYRRQSTLATAWVRAHPPAWYISGTRFANRRTSTGWSGGRSPPNTIPTSTWNGLPE